MKSECNKYCRVDVCALTICLLLFALGCDSSKDLNKERTTNHTISSAEIEESVSDTTEMERENKLRAEKEDELRNKQDEDRNRIEAEQKEIRMLQEKYKEITIKEISETVSLFEAGKISYTEAKEAIEVIVHFVSHWNYGESDDDTYPKGACSIYAKNAIASSGIINERPPFVVLYRDEMHIPIMGFSKHATVTANEKPKIQIQLGEQPPEDVYYENVGGRPFLRLTEKQYGDIVRSEHDIKILLIKDDNTIIVRIASGNIRECADKIEQNKLNYWKYDENHDAFDKATYRFCSSISSNKVNASLAFGSDNKEAPKLTIRQKNHNTPEIILHSKGILWPSYWNHRIRIKFNDETPVSYSYSMGAGSATVIFINSEKKVLQKLFTAKRVTFQMPDSKETFSYDLSELPETCAGLELSGIVK